MQFWRTIAIVLGSFLMCGEMIRSWGQGRNLLFVVDDFLIGIPLVITGLLMSKRTLARHCAFSAAFAATAGMLYPSFFGKLVEPSAPVSSNINAGLLTTLIGIAFFLSLLGAFCSIYLASRSSTSKPTV